MITIARAMEPVSMASAFAFLASRIQIALCELVLRIALGMVCASTVLAVAKMDGVEKTAAQRHAQVTATIMEHARTVFVFVSPVILELNVRLEFAPMTAMEMESALSTRPAVARKDSMDSIARFSPARTNAMTKDIATMELATAFQDTRVPLAIFELAPTTVTTMGIASMVLADALLDTVVLTAQAELAPMTAMDMVPATTSCASAMKVSLDSIAP